MKKGELELIDYAIYFATGNPAKDTNKKKFGKQQIEMSYHKVYYTTSTEYYVDITEYTKAGDILTVWIESRDGKWNDYYHSGTHSAFHTDHNYR